ncbi:hypothetical protein HY572_01395 [Candidatus Micrarchaeota archaeon]|nr:hypothetical protein [Candidatus Micrarchaeota archaeon]
MTIADDVASIWVDVPKTPAPGAQPAYYASILRKTMQSKKMVVETGRPHTILPDVRERVRRQFIRVPSEHVTYLELTVFDLLANPLKKNLQPFVSEFTDEDVSLVEWFVSHAKKDATLALDVKELQAWLEKRKSSPIQTQERVEPPVSEANTASPSNPAPDPATPASSTDFVPVRPVPQDGVVPDRIFES